jgi:hypothetical protein
MCPLCLVNAAMLVAGAGSSGGILAMCVSKSRKHCSGEESVSAAQDTGETPWQQSNAQVLNLEQTVSN